MIDHLNCKFLYLLTMFEMRETVLLSKDDHFSRTRSSSSTSCLQTLHMLPVLSHSIGEVKWISKTVYNASVNKNMVTMVFRLAVNSCQICTSVWFQQMSRAVTLYSMPCVERIPRSFQVKNNCRNCLKNR